MPTSTNDHDEYEVGCNDKETAERDQCTSYKYNFLMNGAHYEESSKAACDEVPEGGWNRFFVKSWFDHFDRCDANATAEDARYWAEVRPEGSGGLKFDAYYPTGDDLDGSDLYEPTFSIGYGGYLAGVNAIEVPLTPESGYIKTSGDREVEWSIECDEFPDDNEYACGAEFDVEANEGLEDGNHKIWVKSEFGYSYQPCCASPGRYYSETKSVETEVEIDIT